jgi:hypothetical protein
MSNEVYRFLDGYSAEVRELALRVRELILKTVPKADEKVYTGWGTIGYSHSGGMKTQFCAVSPQRDRVNLYFNRGTELADPEHLLEGTGKNMRHVKVRTLNDAQSKALKQLIADAAALIPQA